MSAIDHLLSYISTTVCVVFAGVALLTWWALHVVAQRRVDALYAQMKALDDGSRAKLFAEMPPRLKADIERRIRDEKTA
jgi:hypothetical protein